MERVVKKQLPFKKLSSAKYLLIEVLMHIEYRDALNFIYTINKDASDFLTHNYTAIRNSFENEGLITYEIETYSFRSCQLLEKLYFDCLKR
jgi:hypothetical protein